MKASQAEAVGRLVDDALHAVGRVRGTVPAVPTPEAPAPRDESTVALLEDRLAALWKAFTAAEARVRELEAVLAARASAAETLLAETRQGVAHLERRLAESEGRRHELERTNASQRGQLDDLLRRLGALEAQAGAAPPRAVRVPVREPE